MQVKILLALFSAIFIVSGCASVQVAGQVQRGRGALLRGEPKLALSYFQRAGEMDPNYFKHSPLGAEGIWTFTGRAYYNMKQYAEARKSLERALSSTEQDLFARLYLGLALGQTGDRQQGLREIEAALKGFHGTLEDIAYYDPDREFWDSTGELRKVIRNQLASISGREFEWPELISDSEWLGKQLEEEIDLSIKLRRREETRDADDGRDDN